MSLWRKVTAKPWEHAGELTGLHGGYQASHSAARIGLTVFLGVISSLFILFMISYYSRSQYPDWEVLADPGILWINTAILVLASAALQLASNAAKHKALARMKTAVLVGAVLTAGFIAGQLVAWDQLVENGYYASRNPAYAFFYLVTGLHALHLAGGMWFLGRLGIRMKNEDELAEVRYNVRLCATYWHYLLLVWAALFILLLRT